MADLHHYIHGEKVAGESGRFAPVFNPSTGEQSAQVPLATVDEVRKAVESAAEAAALWGATSPVNRARVMFRFKDLVEKNIDELAELLSSEHGKVFDDSKGSIVRGLEVCEFACGAVLSAVASDQ